MTGKADNSRDRMPQRKRARPLLSGRLLIAALTALLLLPVTAGTGYACDNCSCVPIAHGEVIPPPPGYTYPIYCRSRDTIRCVLRDEHQITTDHILEEFEDLEEFLVDPADPLNPTRIWGKFLLPAWMMMTEQLVHTAMYQTLIVGTFFDAKQQLESQALFQRMTAEAHKDYLPSVEMCTFGTNIRSLAETERNYEYTTFVLSQRSIDRQMGNMNSEAARGQFDDDCFRLRQFRKRYCDLNDNNAHMNMICNPGSSSSSSSGSGSSGTVFFPECKPDSTEITEETKNKDISFTRTVDRANTLDLDFYTPNSGTTTTTTTTSTANADPSGDEQDVFALANNLYSNTVMHRMSESAMRARSSQDELLDMRTIVAKRSVAEHSFNTIVGMRAQSKEEAHEMTYPYMRILLENIGLGVTGDHAEDEIKMYLGDRPSYYAQMGVLTKRLYQNPDFFANLYDEPANVERKGVALQAIGLMQDFDTWQSYLRTEAMLSVILELELLRLNNQVQSRLSTLRSGGVPL